MKDVRFVNVEAIGRLLSLRQAHRITWRSVGVGVVLATFMDRSGVCRPSRTTIAARAHLSVRNVSVAITQLAAAGFVEIVRQEGKANRYRLTRVDSDTRDDTDTGVGTDTTPGPHGGDGSLVGSDTQKEPRRNQEPKRASRKGKKSDPNGGHVWGLWVQVNRDAGRRDPVTHGKDTSAAKTLAGMITRGEFTIDELRDAMAAYLSKGEKFLVENGHALSFLPRKLNRYLNGPPVDPEVAAAEALSDEASLGYRDRGTEDRLAAEGKL